MVGLSRAIARCSAWASAAGAFLAGVANARTAHDTALFVFLHGRLRWPGSPARINDLYTILMLHVPIITLSECASEYSKAGMI
jgi:hypothetical protein